MARFGNARVGVMVAAVCIPFFCLYCAHRGIEALDASQFASVSTGVAIRMDEVECSFDNLTNLRMINVDLDSEKVQALRRDARWRSVSGGQEPVLRLVEREFSSSRFECGLSMPVRQGMWMASGCGGRAWWMLIRPEDGRGFLFVNYPDSSGDAASCEGAYTLIRTAPLTVNH